MPLDSTNPGVPVDTSLVEWRTKTAEAATRQAAAIEAANAAMSGDSVTEGGIYQRFLCAVLTGKLVATSDDAQVWATDLTRDYLVKYNVNGTKRTA